VITEEQKYRAETSKIAGFALMTPIGRIVLDPLLLEEFGFIGGIAYLMVAILLCLCGIVAVVKGCDILDINRRR